MTLDNLSYAFFILVFLFLSGASLFKKVFSKNQISLLWNIPISCALGIVVQIVGTSIFMIFGIEVKVTSRAIFAILGLHFFLRNLKINSHKKINMSFVNFKKNKISKILNLVLAVFIVQSALAPFIFLQSGSILNVRLGIDAAMYADGARALIFAENVPNLQNILEANPGSLASALFFIHFRWGISVLFSIIASNLGITNSLTIALVTMTIVLLLIALITLRILKNRLQNSQHILIAGVAITSSNTFFGHLLIESQWPNLLAILFILLIIYAIDYIYQEQSSNIEYLKIGFLLSLILIAVLLTYAEIILLMTLMFLGINFIIYLSRCRYENVLKKAFILPASLIGAILFFVVFSPMHITYFKSIIFPTYANVGYPPPRTIYLSDLLGLTNLWEKPELWLSPIQSVAILDRPRYLELLDIANVIIIATITFLMIATYLKYLKASKHLSKRNWNTSHERSKILMRSNLLLTLFLIAVLMASYTSAILVNQNKYLFIKASTIILIPLVIEALTYLNVMLSMTFWRNLVLLTSCVLILPQNLIEFHNLQKTSVPLYNQNLQKSWKTDILKECAILFNSRNLPSGNFRYVNRTIDYYMESVFNKELIIDPWSNYSLVRPQDAKALEDKKICIVLRKPFSFTNNLESLEKLYASDYWRIYKTKFTYKDAVRKFGALENFQDYYLILNK